MSETFFPNMPRPLATSRRQVLQKGLAAMPFVLSGACTHEFRESTLQANGADVSIDTFGYLEDGRPVRLARLTQVGGITVEICEFGGIVKAITLAGSSRSLVLGFENLDDYVTDQRYICGVVGRVANRIAGGQFILDGRKYVVSQNRDGDCLHGGFRGFNKRLWRIIGASKTPWPIVTLAYRSEHMEEGFPGQLDVLASFSLPKHDRFSIAFEATTTRPTPVNLSHHFYFNLGTPSESTILDHELTIAAANFTPINSGAIPTGEISSVTGTPFDLREPRRIGEIIAATHPQIDAGRGLNHNWVLDDKRVGPSLVLRSQKSGISMAIDTDQPGMQINSGHRLGIPFPQYGGLIVEPQHFPDSVNHPNFPNTILRPGNVYRARYSLDFSRTE